MAAAAKVMDVMLSPRAIAAPVLIAVLVSEFSAS